MMTIGSNQKLNVIGYVCQNDNVEHFSESTNYNVSALPSHTYASVEPFGNSNIEHFGSTAYGNEGTEGKVDCGMGSMVVQSVDIDYGANTRTWWGGTRRQSAQKRISCDNQSECKMIVNNNLMGGDPVPYVGKNFTMKANCAFRSQYQGR
jgi:hypothetical protein